MLVSLLLLSSKQNKKRQNRTEQDNTCESPAPCSKCDSAKVLASKANSLSLEDCGNIMLPIRHDSDYVPKSSWKD